jgi:hypothetical protein
MLPRLYPTTLIVLWAATAGTAFAGPEADPVAADCAPSCERKLCNTQVYLVPQQHATTLPSLKVREVNTTVPTMGLKIDFKEEKRTVCVTSVKPREEERVVTSTTMVPETYIDPHTHCEATRYTPVCLTKTVKVTVMDCVQETKEVIVKVPVLTPVESSVVVTRLALDVSTVPAVANTYKLVIMPSKLSVPALPPPCLPPSSAISGH